jgi:hypothetical protein
MAFFDQLGGGNTGSPGGGPLANLFGGDPRQLMQLALGRTRGWP